MNAPRVKFGSLSNGERFCYEGILYEKCLQCGSANARTVSGVGHTHFDDQTEVMVVHEPIAA